jgi:hypothetical protein
MKFTIKNKINSKILFEGERMRPSPKQVIELLDIFNDIRLTKVQAIDQIWQKAQDKILDNFIKFLEILSVRNEYEISDFEFIQDKIEELKNRKVVADSGQHTSKSNDFKEKIE